MTNWKREFQIKKIILFTLMTVDQIKINYAKNLDLYQEISREGYVMNNLMTLRKNHSLTLRVVYVYKR